MIPRPVSVLASLLVLLPALGQGASTPPATASAASAAIKLDSDALNGIAPRSIGPAAMGGRIAAIDGLIEEGRVTLWVGAASGGVWLSKNGGTSFKPKFDKYNQSIGAIRVDRKDSKTIWVGTGEPWTRNSVSLGDGVYKSTDGGENWTKVGLADSERITSIEIDPSDSNTVYVCATGHLWNANEERGLYKTTDGGKSWNRILYVDADTGCGGMALDLNNPKTLFASMWTFRRSGWSFSSGGPNSGFYKSTDGGATWVKLNGDPKRGLPQGDLGRVAIAIAPTDSKIVYATVEAKDGGIFRSVDGGETWEKRNGAADMTIRPFYFSVLYVDPKNPERVYKPGLNLVVSDDGGKAFNAISGGVHSDLHALFLNPQNPEQMFVGTDGGLFTTEDRGATWRFIRNLPLAQYYHVAVDDDTPYNVYGGLQDNSCWQGPSETGGGIENRHWHNYCGGDGFHVLEDPADANFVYAETQGGELVRVRKGTYESRGIKPQEKPGDEKFRFNWNTPLAVSPTDKATLYLGSQYLLRSKDHGNSWERISPDLTTNDKAKQQQENSGGVTIDNSSAETHCTIYAISESPKNPLVIWAGTDDGNLQLTKDGGKHWANVAANVSGLPKGTWVSSIEASPFDAAAALVTFDGHTSGDMKSYIYRTTDFGKNWVSIVSDDLKGFAHVVRQDPINKNLLFAGTEAGLFVSINSGGSWARIKAGEMPPVPVRDLAFQRKRGDLVIATHGRGVYIIDDLTPLRAITPEILDKDVAFLPTRPSMQSVLGFDGWFGGGADFVGEGPDPGAQIAYYLKKKHIIGEMKLEILDAKGDVIWTIPPEKRRGINRVSWAMRTKAPTLPPGGGDLNLMFRSAIGPQVLDGTYTARLTKNKEVYTTEITIVPDPRSQHTRAERELRYDTLQILAGMINTMTEKVNRILALRDGARSAAEKLGASNPAVGKQALAASQQLESFRAELVPTKEAGGITGEVRMRERVTELYGNINAIDGAPSSDQLARLETLKKETGAAYAKLAAWEKTELAALNSALTAAGEKPLP